MLKYNFFICRCIFIFLFHDVASFYTTMMYIFKYLPHICFGFDKNMYIFHGLKLQRIICWYELPEGWDAGADAGGQGEEGRQQEDQPAQQSD